MSRNHRGLTGAAWLRLRRQALDRDNWRCVRCESPIDLEMHHKRPLAADGEPYALDNVRMLCTSCHVDAHRVIEDPERAAWMRLLREES